MTSTMRVTVWTILVAAVASLSLSSADRVFPISKCCPADKSLIIRNGDLGSSHIDCVISDQQGFSGYNVRQDAEPHIPGCSFELHEFDKTANQINTNGCIDYTERGLSGLSCPSEPLVHVRLFNKCCPAGHSYDYSEQYCVPNENYLNHFSAVFDESVVIFEPKVPRCNADDELFVEYHSSIHEIQLSSGGLIISSPSLRNDYLPKEKFCIEGTVNHVGDAVGGSTSASDAMHVVVRSCRPRSICEEIPCVRRCCENDQVLLRDDDRNVTECRPHPLGKTFRPDFHKIDDWTVKDKTPEKTDVPCE